MTELQLPLGLTKCSPPRPNPFTWGTGRREFRLPAGIAEKRRSSFAEQWARIVGDTLTNSPQ